MIALAAEDSAIEDAMYALDRALLDKLVDTPTFVKARPQPARRSTARPPQDWPQPEHWPPPTRASPP